MKEMKLLFILLVIIIAVGSFFRYQENMKQPLKSSQVLTNNQSKNMKISSPAFENNGDIPPKYTCDQEGASLPIEFSGVPAEAKSLALIMEDPDAPMAGGFVHWVIFNMNPKTSEIRENMKPESGIEGTGSSGKNGYIPPCPPSGAHHYHFKLYALDSELNLNESAKREDVEKAMEEHIIDRAEIIGLYKRQ
jgi:Raf kinase inhibitor-like YbhB/YbcL family protein